MELVSEFIDISPDTIHQDAETRQSDGWRYVQILAVNKEGCVDLVYSYMKDGMLQNVVAKDVPRDAEIPSISDLFLEAFVCENEIHDLFGVAFQGIAIDFLGNFYKVAEEYPMTIISPEQLAAREKAKKVAAAKAAKEAKETSGTQTSSDEDMEAKLAAMPPEKAAKVRAAMEAKAKKEKESTDAELEAKLAAMPPEKAEKVRAAMEAKAAKEAEKGE